MCRTQITLMDHSSEVKSTGWVTEVQSCTVSLEGEEKSSQESCRMRGEWELMGEEQQCTRSTSGSTSCPAITCPYQPSWPGRPAISNALAGGCGGARTCPRTCRYNAGCRSPLAHNVLEAQNNDQRLWQR